MNYSSKTNHQTSNRLQRRLILLTLTITFSVGILFSTVCTSLYRDYLETSLVHSTDTNLKFLTDSIDQNLESVFKLIRWSQTNNTISEYVAVTNDEKYASTAVNAHERLTEEYQNSSANPYLQRVVIGNYHDRFIQVVPTVYSSNQNLSKAIPSLPYFDTLMQAKSVDLSTGFIKDPFYQGSSGQVIPILRPIYAQYHSNITGWVFLEITEELFTAPLEYYSCAEDAGLFLVIDKHCYSLNQDKLYPADENFNFSIENELTNSKVSKNSKVYSLYNEANGKNTIVVLRKLSQTDCYIAQTLSDIELQNQYHMLTLIWILICALMLIVGLMLTYALHYMIAVPIGRIQKQITKVSAGDFTPDTSIEWEDELGDIGRGINILAADIEALMETRIADEKEKKDLEYKVLQNQVNPHFLYNTLNSIKWMAMVQGAEGIADMTTSLSRLLRSISKGTKLQIPISEELSLVKDYFNIQNYRYGGTIQLEIDCKDERLLDYSIIKFTLQPIVENAIFHGLEPKGNIGYIKIIIQDEPASCGKDIELIVWDNGVGIPQDKIDNLLTSNADAAPEFFKEIGVSNVHQRLQYEYGENYGIHIKSVVGEFTAMHIVIPKC